MRNRLDTVMFFCAGRGTRMGALTQNQPKPMISVSGRPLVDHAIDQAAGIPRQFANLHYHPEVLKSHLETRDITTVFEADLLETGGGLKAALPYIDRETVFTMNTDAVWQGPLAQDILMREWDPSIMDALLLVVPQSRAHAHKGQGDFLVDQTGKLQRGPGDVYTGFQIIKTSYLRNAAETAFSINEVWKTLLERKTMFGVHYPGHWCDVGYPEAIPIAEQLLER